jgi:hypothetical protein
VRGVRRRRSTLRLTRLLELHFLFELLAELPRHGPRPANPAANLGDDARQFLRSQHDQRQDEDDQDFEEPAFEQIRCSGRS